MTGELAPGEVIIVDGTIALNERRETTEVTVENTGDRPIQVGSHFHFFEANAALLLNREAVYGIRLNIFVGTAVQFEPGDQTLAELVAIGGKRRAHEMNGMVNGSVDADPGVAVEHLRVAGFTDTGAPDDEHGIAEGSSE